MKQVQYAALTAVALVLAACGGGKQVANKDNFEQAINRFAAQEKVCLPVAVAGDGSQAADAPLNGMLGDPVIRIVERNAQGDRINKQALKQMDVLVDAGLYRKGDKAEINVGGRDVPMAVFERTEQGAQQVQSGPQGSLLCLGHQKVEEIALFTEPTAANGVTVSKVVYDAKLEPEKWVGRLLKSSAPDLAETIKQPQRQNVTLVLTNQGWRDLRELH